MELMDISVEPQAIRSSPGQVAKEWVVYQRKSKERKKPLSSRDQKSQPHKVNDLITERLYELVSMEEVGILKSTIELPMDITSDNGISMQVASLIPDSQKSLNYEENQPCKVNDLINERLNDLVGMEGVCILQPIVQDPMDIYFDDGISVQVAPLTLDSQKSLTNCQRPQVTDAADGTLIEESMQENYEPKNVHFQQETQPHKDVSLERITSQFPERKDGDEEELTDLNRRPLKKTRRKKHRPKVVHDSKSAKTPKTVTPKPVTPTPAMKRGNLKRGNLTTDRTFVQKMKSSINSQAPLEYPCYSSVAEDVVDPGTKNRPKRLRRNLMDDFEISPPCACQARDAVIGSIVTSRKKLVWRNLQDLAKRENHVDRKCHESKNKNPCFHKTNRRRQTENGQTLEYDKEEQCNQTDQTFTDAESSMTLEKMQGLESILSCNQILHSQDHLDCSNIQKSLHATLQSLEIVPYLTPTDDTVQKLKSMNMNQVEDASQVQSSLIPYNGGGMMVPYDSSPASKKKFLPKVDVDPETSRVWNLLMGNDSSEGDEGMDTDKDNRWEEERRIFQERVRSFIARMNLILGNRRFSEWKGSVVDSVVGAFLTQNVSDHLSSSAFINLASRFPIQSKDIDRESNLESGDSNKRKENVSSPKACSYVSLASHETTLGENLGDGMTYYSKEKDLFICRSGVQIGLGTPQDRTDIPDAIGEAVDRMTLGDVISSENSVISSKNTLEKMNIIESDLKYEAYSSQKVQPGIEKIESSAKKPKAKTKKQNSFHWDELRRQAVADGAEKERRSERMDSVDWEAVRKADVKEVAYAIRGRGQHNVLAERIKDFLDRVVRDHGSIDLEWLRHTPPEKAKEYLLSIPGLGPKSVDCIRLLSLHHKAFPVDVNVGRTAVRQGLVPLRPLPGSLQLHLLEEYPVLETIQMYLWPRLCTLDVGTLYELHYHMITFGKVFCTKGKPNCNACPMKLECKHFASAFASARLALPEPEEKSLVTARNSTAFKYENNTVFDPTVLPQLECGPSHERNVSNNFEPIIEEPATPECESSEILERDIEDFFYYDDPDEIPTLNLNREELPENLQNYIQENRVELQNGDMSKALVVLSSEAASIPIPKLKNVTRLRTEHQVYELDDSHPLLEGMDQRDPDDPCPYLLAIWDPGETAESTESPQICCNSQKCGELCVRKTCSACNSVQEAQDETVRGTLLIPCRTAMRGSFPLNGTYFQVNEVFADHKTSYNPIKVPRYLIWNLRRRTVYCGTSVPPIFRGLTMENIQQCFQEGYICVREFDRVRRAVTEINPRWHLAASKAPKNKKRSVSKDE